MAPRTGTPAAPTAPPRPSTVPPAAAAFAPGDTVEISSTDVGFCNSFFSGTVVRLLSPSASPKRRRVTAFHHPPRNCKYLIQFDKLFEDEAGTKQVTEKVEEWQLRPLPPREPWRVFKKDVIVDAYHNDGWWQGVITEELGQGKFEVYLRTSKESIQFKAKDMRFHRLWTNNAWYPPFNEEQQSFKKGALVEVSRDEDGHRGAWYSAKIAEEVPSEGTYLVEFPTLTNDDDTKLLVKEIDTLHIRPRPPKSKASHGFKYGEEVDAHYKDGWWVGVVAKVLGESRFEVSFRDDNEVLEFNGSELRPHSEWIDGKWCIGSQSLNL